jgi:MFS family permease
LGRRSFYLVLLCLLAVITYLDRVCISVAGPRIQAALHLGSAAWGWVGTAFMLGYGGFEIPSGHLGDRIGARRVLTRIVLWWSAFTALTGAVSTLPLLLLVRFLFGAGEAGAFPNAAVAISRWFSVESRGRAFGLFSMCTQIGGAISPLLVIPIQQRFGWRASFFVFGSLGIAWAALWYAKFQDDPPGAPPRPPAPAGDWWPLLRSRDLWGVMTMTFGYVYSMSFFQTWLHTFLVRGHGFREDELSISALPFAFGAAGNLLGGLACDRLVRSVGLKWSRRAVGIAGAVLSTSAMGAASVATGHTAVILCLSLAYAGIALQQPAVFAACLDIGGARGGAVAGFMNTAGQVGGATSSLVFGYTVKATGSYAAPLVPMAALLAIAIVIWWKVDVTRTIPRGGEPSPALAV